MHQNRKQSNSPPPPRSLHRHAPPTLTTGMKCRLHSTDLSSGVGVCASCLRERLFLLISAQSQTHLLEDCRSSDPPPDPLTFPRSVSPYISRRKFNDEDDEDGLDPVRFADRMFHSTPQACPSIGDGMKKKKRSGFSFITNLFKSRLDKSESDPRTASASSPLWCPAGSKSKSVPKFVGERITQNRVSDRGMSPERPSSDGEDSSSRSSESCEPTWKQTPISSAAAPRRRHSNMSGLAFCLSPLVRASPNRNGNWNRNSLPPESTDGAAASRKASRLAVANSFCKNRSKKMADFGRGGYDHRR